LWSPSTSSANPKLVNDAFVEEAKNLEVKILTGEKVIGAHFKNNCWTIQTASNEITASSHVYNAGGLYADQIARHFGFSDKYKVRLCEIIPF
jgi:L-2-hydroxyglutarate oxidase LhgO